MPREPAPPLWARALLVCAAAELLYFAFILLDASFDSRGVAWPLFVALSKKLRSKNASLMTQTLVMNHPFIVAAIAYLSILAAGWKNRGGRRYGIIIWWANCGLWVLLLLLMFVSSDMEMMGVTFLILLASVALGGLASLIFWLHPVSRTAPGRCARCGYDLRGNVSRRCPECGKPFDPTVPRAPP